MIKVLFAGDIVGSLGREYSARTVYSLRGKEKIDIVIVNGENSADGNGITKESMEELFTFADVITTGNHCFRRKEFIPCYDANETLLRPVNYPEGVEGRGVCILDKGSYSFAVVNLMGTVFMESLANPFETMENLLPALGTPNILVDFHGEATGEKKAMGFFLDGRVSAVTGTHTHVQTADETILPGGTAYITDAGMCGSELSVLGVRAGAGGEKAEVQNACAVCRGGHSPFFCGVMLAIDEKTGRAQSIERLQIRN